MVLTGCIDISGSKFFKVQQNLTKTQFLKFNENWQQVGQNLTTIWKQWRKSDKILD